MNVHLIYPCQNHVVRPNPPPLSILVRVRVWESHVLSRQLKKHKIQLGFSTKVIYYSPSKSYMHTSSYSPPWVHVRMTISLPLLQPFLWILVTRGFAWVSPTACGNSTSLMLASCVSTPLAESSLHVMCEPKMVPTCAINPSKPLGVGFWCFTIILKNIRRVRLGVKSCLGFRLILCSWLKV